MDSVKGLKIIHLNIRSLLSKIDLLRIWVEQHQPSVITISETWLTNTISDNEIKLTNYILYRADRGTRGGGVATYVSSALASEVIVPTVEPSHFESIFIKVILHENKYITIGNIYRPPSAPAESFNSIVSTINSINDKNELILLGDFNKNWTDKSSNTAKNILGNLNLTQLITEPTRVTPTTQSLLDWILVSHPNRFIKSGILPDSFSDHCIIFCTWKIKLPKLPPKFINIRQYKKININQFINDLISVNWDRFQIIPNVHEAWNFFHSEFMKIVDRHAPFKTIKVKGSHLPWVSSELISIFRQRDMAWGTYRQTKNIADWERYRLLRNKSKTMCRNAKSNHFKESFSHDNINSKEFWKKIKTLTNESKTNNLNKLKVNNTVLHNPLSVAQAFNQHFSSVCAPTLSHPYVISNNTPPCHSTFSFKPITPVEVMNAINELKVSSGAGLDGVENKFLKIASHILMYPLCDLFNLSLSTCEIPTIWKCSRITPIHKAGSELDPNNYRPISIICSIAKVFEKLIHKQLSNYLSNHNILSPVQSGFRANHSTTTTLLKLTNDIFSSSSTGKLTGALFIDLSKAFDLVDHYLLLDKLYSIGLSRKSLLWFSSYLHNRKQCVVIQGNKSELAVQERGVPQGSTLGPLLFTIFINDLPSILSDCSVQLYADDTVIYTSQPTLPQIQSTIQSNFNYLETWLSANRLIINKTKTNTMLFGTNHNLKTIANNNQPFTISCIDGTQILKVDKIKYLGLWLDSELSYKCHIDNLVRKINYSTSVLYRNRNCFTFSARKKIVLQAVLPIMDYADIVYQTTNKTILHPLNTVYNRLCRFVLDCPFMTHHCILYENLNLTSPTVRRQQHWLQFIFKSIHFNYPQYLKQYLVPYSSQHQLRHTSQIYFKVPPRLTNLVGKKSFMYKAPTDWNNLPIHIRSITSFRMFKTALSSHLETTCTCIN